MLDYQSWKYDKINVQLIIIKFERGRVPIIKKTSIQTHLKHKVVHEYKLQIWNIICTLYTYT